MNDVNLIMANTPQGRPDDAVDCPRCCGDGWLEKDQVRKPPREQKKCVKCGKVVGTNSGHDLEPVAEIPNLKLPDGTAPNIELPKMKLCHTCWSKENYATAEAWERHEEEMMARAEAERDLADVETAEHEGHI